MNVNGKLGLLGTLWKHYLNQGNGMKYAYIDHMCDVNMILYSLYDQT